MRKRRSGGNGAALQAAISLAFVVPAAAQPAPNARPLGGQVVAGSAAIAAGPTTTTINQSSPRAAIDWRSFNVGSNQSVVFNQPGANSVTLNRVTGPDPSAIAGRISANGQLVLTNPSGVVFHAGSQVNAQSVIVSAPGITNQNFMAGRMVFDQPASPNARIENAGSITVKQAGLAALVAPSVANSGTITARMGHVVLAGAAAHTLDMYGDGLVSIDVTKQVTQAPVGVGGKAVTALVTNSGTIAADGGTVQLTARAADGVVNTLVQAGGRIQANTAGGRAGQIEIAGTGGSVVIEGRIAADGRAAGTAGGSVVAAGSDATLVAPTARISADGRSGGGTVAIGTTLARARSSGPAPAGTSARTVVAAGARISASATASGDGGRVTVLSTQSTAMGGAVAARGGPGGGNGGTIELSGETGFRLTGTADTSAPHGTLGTVVLDPRDLTITDTPNGTNAQPTDGADPSIGYDQGGTATDAYVTSAQLENLTSNIHVQTTRDLVVASSFSGSGNGVANNITLEAGRNLTVNTGVTITNAGSPYQTNPTGVITLTAAASNIPGYDPAGTLTVSGSVSGVDLNLNAGTGGIALSGSLSTQYGSGGGSTGATVISTTGPVVQTSGSLNTGSLSGSAASITLVATANQISSIDGASPLTATQGGVSIVTSLPLTVTAGASSPGIVAAAGATISLQTDTLTLQPGGAGVPVLSAPGGTVALLPVNTGRAILVSASDSSEGSALYLSPAELGSLATGTLQLGRSNVGNGGITLGVANEAIDLSSLGIGALALASTSSSSTGAPTISQGGPLTVGSLSVTGGLNTTITLDNPANQIGALSSLAANDGNVVSTAGNLALGTVSVDQATITAGGSITQGNGTLSSSSGLSLNAGNGIYIGGGASIANTLTLSAGTGGVTLSGSVRATTLQVSTQGALTGGGAVNVTDLNGTAASVSLVSPGNGIIGVSQFTTNAGDFTLVDGAGLTVGSSSRGISVPTGSTISLTTDALSLAGPLSAPGGVVALQPFTAGAPTLVTTAARGPALTLTLTTGGLARIQASELRLGGVNPGTGAATSGSITVGQRGDSAIDLGGYGIGRLTLSTGGAVQQNAALAVTTLAGSAGSVALTNVGNTITTLDGLSAGGDLALHTSSGLTVSNAVSAGGALTLSSEAVITGRTDGVSLLLAAPVSGATVRFDTTNGAGGATGVLQTAGTITAGTLTGATGTMSLPQANQIAALGDITTAGNLTVTDGRAVSVSGAVTSMGAVTLNARGITQTPTSSITTAELDGSSSADTVLDSSSNAISGLGSFTQTAGNFTLVTAAPELDFGANSGQVSAASGTLTFVADRMGLVTQPAPGTSLSASGPIAFAPLTPGRPIVLVDTASPGQGVLGLSTALVSKVHSNTLTLGRVGYTGPIVLGGPNESLDFSAFRAIQLQTTGAVTQGANSVWSVPSLFGTAGSISLPGSLPGNNNVTALGLDASGTAVGLTATAGPLTVGAQSNLTLYGPISATSAITVSSGNTGALTILGSVSAPSVSLFGGGALSQGGSSQISANTLLISANSAALNGSGNRFGTLQANLAGDLALSSTSGLSIASGTTVGGTLTLTVGGVLTGGPVTAQTITGSADSVSLVAPGNRIGALGAFTSRAGFNLTNSTSLTVTGAVSDASAITLNVAGDLALAGSLSSPQVSLVSTGAISQPGGVITTGTLTGNATGSAVLAQGGNRINTLAGFTTGVDFALVDARSLTVTAPVDPNTVHLVVNGDLTLASSVTGGNVILEATGAIRELPGGQIVADTLTGQADSASLGGSNQVATLGGFATSTGFTLFNSAPLTIAGPLYDGTAVSLAVAGALTLAGDVSTPGQLSVTVAGPLTQTNGNLQAKTFSSMAESIDLGRGGSVSVPTITSLIATGASPGTLTLVDSTPLQISGTLSGHYLSISAPGQLQLADGTVIRTDGQPLASQLGTADAGPGSNLAVRPGAGGRASLIQLGAVTIAPLTAGAATLRVDLPASGGTVAFNNLQAGGANLVLNLGAGTATGRLVANNLTVLGASGQAVLTGTVGGQSGNRAAQTAALLPRVDTSYTLNGCAISITSCSGIPLTSDAPSVFQPDVVISSLIASAVATVLRPDILALDVLDLSVTRDRDDPTLLLPNISDKDY